MPDILETAAYGGAGWSPRTAMVHINTTTTAPKRP